MPLLNARSSALFAGALALAVTATSVGLSAGAAPAAAAGTTATPVSTTILAAPDYASTTFHDAWDYSNTADLLIDNSGPTIDVANAKWSGGVLSYTAEPRSYVSPLWGGYPGSLYLDRDGGLAANHITASNYNYISIHAYSSATVSSAIQWFTSPSLNSSTEGGQPFNLLPGWHEYLVPLGVNVFPKLTKNWAGTIEGIRFATSPASDVTIKLDNMRLYKAGADPTAMASWDITGDPVVPYWSSNGATSCAAESQTCGAVVEPGTTDIGATTGRLTVDASAYPPGTTLFLAAPGGGAAVPGSAVHIAARPQPIVDSPSAAGCGDFATSTFGHEWLGSKSTVTVKNASGEKLSGGKLTATNTSNDPEVLFATGGGINASVWRYLSVTETYTGDFNLLNEPGGGTMARAMWASGGRPVSQTQDLLTYHDRPTLNIDLGMPASVLTETSASVRYAFSGTVTTMRWDPNEDPGKRNWTLSNVTLGRECATTAAGYAVTWHDPGWTSGTKATVEAVSGSTVRTLGTVTESSGENSFSVREGTVPLGNYTIRVVSTSPLYAATGTGNSATPLRITPSESRVAGTDRYATAVQVSKSEFPKGTKTVLIASGANYPDALAAAPAAAVQKGALLLTAPTALPSSIAAELRRLKPAHVYLIGGPNAVSAGVARQVTAATGVSPVRVSGADRYATSAAVAARFFTAARGRAFVATGAGFPDALSAASAATRIDAPVLLVPGTSANPTSAVAKQLARLKPTRIYAVGGTTVVSSAMVTRLGRTAPTSRLAGADRYGTSQAVGKTFDTGTSNAALLANGSRFPDALVGASLAGARAEPLYLSQPSCLPSPITSEVTRLDVKQLTLVGGTAVLSSALPESTC
ncbi:cell wall-binding repeat-containing protein [Gryllotalpicola reticulitermitis]|uniref:Cell wall-binding repeat-containing protein n=1 Tax=Gryllotalpicola reticulitermitis TaxID=1184153 RepID=A0ABV8Q7I9_9MICO